MWQFDGDGRMTIWWIQQWPTFITWLALPSPNSHLLPTSNPPFLTSIFSFYPHHHTSIHFQQDGVDGKGTHGIHNWSLLGKRKSEETWWKLRNGMESYGKLSPVQCPSSTEMEKRKKITQTQILDQNIAQKRVIHDILKFAPKQCKSPLKWTKLLRARLWQVLATQPVLGIFFYYLYPTRKIHYSTE